MKIKSYFLGVLTGIILTLAGIVIYGIVSQDSKDPIQYLDQPVSYENKTKATFKVLQVLEGAALANEKASNEINLYLGNTVLILGDDFYNDQVITIKNPQRIGTYSYTNNGGMPMTVPVLDGEMN